MWRHQGNRQPAKVTNHYSSGKGFFWSTRTQILLWYILIFGFIFTIFVPAFRHVLYVRVNNRVNREITEKMQVFEELIGGISAVPDEIEGTATHEAANQLRKADKRLIAIPKTQEELEEFFDAFLGNQLPEDDTFLIALTEERFYKSSPRARPKELSRDSQLIIKWAKLTESKRGEEILPGSSIESIVYFAKPVKINGQVMGVFVIANPTSGERGEVLEAVAVIIQVGSGVLFLALILAWFASGKILAPLRLLTRTARNISESDLSQRINIDGDGELAELANTFNEMMDRLQNAFVSQRNFINDAGHELRTPITIIRGNLELMNNDDPQEVEETIVLVNDELERMERFVNDLILLAKAEHPDFLQLETVDIAILTEEIFTKVRALAERNWQLERVGKGKIIADRQRLTQAVMNLAQNATQYTTTTDTISLGSLINKDKFSFWVRDTGEGIVEVDQKRIFQRFARAANSRRRSEGAGLGLSIVQAIVEAHKGEITLESKPGEGSTFTLILPLELS
ncbi:MAG: HAMP domain-containing protein [Scytonematopsis contorta HA4267-MV1]|jgi:signal transduction histidine kinase|nr:HAMP domain-containing protein [Scytonematopsis contorta HA4267-MV1]